MKLVTGIAALTVAIAAAYAAPATAQSTAHTLTGNAAGHCQGALPAFAGSLRARPLAVQNEGTTTAFVTCAFPFDSGTAINGAALKLEIWFVNRTSTPQVVTCTGVSGYASSPDNVYVNQSTTILANGDSGLYWDAAEFADSMDSGLIGVSCQLPAGVGLADTYLDWFT